MLSLYINHVELNQRDELYIRNNSNTQLIVELQTMHGHVAILVHTAGSTYDY